MFLSEKKEEAFFHGHSFTANALGCAAALASMSLLKSKDCIHGIEMISATHNDFIKELDAFKYKDAFVDVRQQGTILAIEFQTSQKSGYFNKLRDKIENYFSTSFNFCVPN